MRKTTRLTRPSKVQAKPPMDVQVVLRQQGSVQLLDVVGAVSRASTDAHQVLARCQTAAKLWLMALKQQWLAEGLLPRKSQP